MGLFKAKAKTGDGPRRAQSIIRIAKAEDKPLEVVVADEDIAEPWHAVADVKDVLDDLATTAEGLTSGEGRGIA